MVTWGAGRPGTRALIAALVVAGLAALTACSGGGGGDGPTIAPESADATTTTMTPGGTPPARLTYVAQARGDIKVWKHANSADSTTLSSDDEGSDLLTFLVIDRRNDGWLEVILPTEPLDKGFLLEKDVVLTRHRFRIEVSLSRSELVLYAGPVEAARSRVALGPDAPAAGTATFIKELRGPEFQNIYGSPVYGLAGGANTAKEFKEGKGVLAIHPVEVPALGKPATAGCIGVDPALLTRFTVELSLPLGTPVDIVE
jgi:hypothetical protein